VEESYEGMQINAIDDNEGEDPFDCGNFDGDRSSAIYLGCATRGEIFRTEYIY